MGFLKANTVAHSPLTFSPCLVIDRWQDLGRRQQHGWWLSRRWRKERGEEQEEQISIMCVSFANLVSSSQANTNGQAQPSGARERLVLTLGSEDKMHMEARLQEAHSLEGS